MLCWSSACREACFAHRKHAYSCIRLKCYSPFYCFRCPPTPRSSAFAGHSLQWSPVQLHKKKIHLSFFIQLHFSMEPFQAGHICTGFFPGGPDGLALGEELKEVATNPGGPETTWCAWACAMQESCGCWNAELSLRTSTSASLPLETAISVGFMSPQVNKGGNPTATSYSARTPGGPTPFTCFVYGKHVFRHHPQVT